MPELPSGTVTFLFTDIEGSTRLWEQHPEAMRPALARHDALLRHAIAAQHGHVFKTIGDQFCAALSTAPEALAAALTAQRALCCEPWGQERSDAWGGPLRVRMALHTGAAEQRDEDYFGPPLNRVARLLEAAHGGQVLVSMTTQELAREAHLPGATLRDLGVHRLKDLHQAERILQLVHPELPSEFPPLRSLEAFAHNLPAQLTSFIGREAVMAEVKQFLATTRLLTLTGSGGCGKTRLALQVAADLLESYADGVWLVELAPLAEPALVPQAVASTLGVREEPGRPLTATLTDTLRPKSLLLVLDNCEHLLSACAQLADTLLRSCPSLRLLASSREGLGILGEQTYRVPSLSLPDARHLPPLEKLQEFEAVQLFADRARLSQATFAVTQANAPSVAQLCERLDGIPLAIELAAARVKALPVEKINERLDDMFRLLTGGSRTALPRQQTLRALIDWSYDLLSPSEQALLRRLSVFAGGWTLEAAEAVCSDDGGPETGDGREDMRPALPLAPSSVPRLPSFEVLDLLTSLVEKSLVVYEGQGGEARYRLLEAVRQYSRGRLLEAGEVESVRNRHRDYFRRLAEEAEAAAPSVRETEWLGRLEVEHDNLLAALEWSQIGEPEVALRFAADLTLFWVGRSYFSEARQWLERTLAGAQSAAPTSERCDVLIWAGQLARIQGDQWTARTRLEDGLGLSRSLGYTRGVGRALAFLAAVAEHEGDLTKARALLEESVALRRAGDNREHCMGLGALAQVALRQGDLQAAQSLAEESLALARESQGEWFIGWQLLGLGKVVETQGDWEAARDLYEQSLTIFRKVKTKSGTAQALLRLGQLLDRHGDGPGAGPLLAESLVIMAELGNRAGIAEGLDGCARRAMAQGSAERAARLLGAAEALRAAISQSLYPDARAEFERNVASVRTALGEERFAAAWAEGRAMSLEAAVQYTVEEEPHV